MPPRKNEPDKRAIKPTNDPYFLDPNEDWSRIDSNHSPPVNYNLHVHYVKTAMQHLSVIAEFRENMNNFSNVHTHDLLVGLIRDVQKLVRENAAYRDAAALLWMGIQPPSDEE